MVTLSTDGWRCPGIGIARSFGERLAGLHTHQRVSGLLLQGSSVHGFGMTTPLTVLGLSQDLEVGLVRTLAPRRIVWIRGATYLLELRSGQPTPTAGARLTIEHG